MKISKVVVYISGPITGMSELNLKSFEEAEMALQRKNCVVINPLSYPMGLRYKDYMDVSIAYIRASDVLLMLDNWGYSKGAVAEKAYGESIGTVICYSLKEVISHIKKGAR